MMKGWRVILTCAALCLCGATAWWAVNAQHGVQASSSRVVSTAPAEYPVWMADDIARAQGISISLSPEEALPALGEWQTGCEAPEIGDSRAVKGGTLRLCNAGPFPANFLAFGSPSLQFFHYNLFDCNDVPLVRQHPATGHEIPGVAEAWQVHEGTLYYRLNPAATWSNGRPVRAADYVLGALLRKRAGSNSHWSALSAAVGAITCYGDHILAVRLRTPSPLAACRTAALLPAAEPGFYSEFGNDYTTRYAWRVPPTTGAYTVESNERGRCISLVRRKNWWAAQLPYFRYSCNADRIEHHFLNDESQLWELFLRGRLDVLQTRNTAAWVRYREQVEANPDIRSYSFSINYPMPPYGIACNAAAVPDVNLRRGIMQALDMDRAIAIIFQGEAERLSTFTTGYPALSPVSTPEYFFNPEKARAAFAQAGYTVQGDDGILQRPDGTPLHITLTFAPSDKITNLVNLLAQSAAECGLKIIPDPVPWQTSLRKLHQKSHQLLFWATVPSVPTPDYERFFSPSATGGDAPFNTDSPALHAAIAQYSAATDTQALANACAAVDKAIYEAAVWLPGWKENAIRMAAWQHVHFPEHHHDYSRFDIVENHLYWIAPAE